MRIGYFGSPRISASLLAAILDAGHTVDFVVTNPDRPRGRRGKVRPTDVGELAAERGLAMFKFPKLRAEAVQELSRREADLFVVFAYGRIFPEELLASPFPAMVNLHASLLPALRGASPILTALLRGFLRTGFTLQRVGVEVDAGDLLASSSLAVRPEETAGELTERMLPLGIDLVLGFLRDPEVTFANARPQPHDLATFCSKITVDDARIDWGKGSLELHDMVRAYNPAPVARTGLGGEVLRIHRTDLVSAELAQSLGGDETSPGGLFLHREGRKKRLFVRTGDGFLEILELQAPGKKVLKSGDFLNAGGRLQAMETGVSFER